MKHILSFLVCFILISSSSCKKFLEQKSADEVIPKTTRDFSEVLLGTGYPSATSAFYTMLNFLDDDTDFNPSASNVVGSVSAKDRFPAYTWQPNLYEVTSGLSGLTTNTAYSVLYGYIRGCNIITDNIDQAIGSQEERDRLHAEALTLRALHYFQLINLYGQPYSKDKNAAGVPIKLTSGLDTKPMIRNTVAEVYAQIVLDLKAAEQLFLKYPLTRADYRVNLLAVYILQSRMYLHMAEWDNAATAANAAIERGGLLTNLTTVTSPYYLLDYANSEIVWLFGAKDASLSTAFKPSADLLSGYGTGDARLNLYFASNRLSVTKYSSSGPASRTGKGLRISEAYLNRAEAYVEKVITGGSSTNISLASADLNELRRNRITGYVNAVFTDPAVLRNAIRTERRKELCFEEQRWFDLRRYGMPEIRHTYRAAVGEADMVYTLKANDPMYTLPLPSVIMVNNTELTQNTSAFEPLRTAN